MNGMIFEATFAMLCRPPIVMAAMKNVRMASVAIFGKPNDSSMLSTMALTCGNVPIPKYATPMQASAKNVASGFHFSPMPFLM